jgi:flavin reductase (DIM6/NTAB) family NADH-FMN oxidoreductase RutF
MTTVSKSFDSTAFRSVLGRYPTGVVVVAALVDGEPLGMAVNSFTSVSLDPPLVAFCVALTSSTWPRMRDAGGYAMSLLTAEQDHTCRTFARRGADRFAGVPWSASPGGHPVLDGASAWLDVHTHATQPAGDHELVLGRVTALGTGGDTAPLVFHRGALTTLPYSAAELSPRRLDTLDTESPFFAVLTGFRGRRSG